MKKLIYTGLLLFTGCVSQREVSKATMLQIGGCYYYNRPVIGGLFSEKVNPFWYRVAKREGSNLVMNVYGTSYSGQLRQNEKRLSQYSVGVSCSVLDSLSKLYRRDL